MGSSNLTLILGVLLFKNLIHAQLQEATDGQTPLDAYLLYGPHGYRSYPHSRCQEVPTADVNLADIEGEWNLIEYRTSFDGKPFPPHSPYLCPESRMTFNSNGFKMNISQLSIEWPHVFQDVIEWYQHPRKSGVFYHEENIYSLWTMKIMEVLPNDHMLVFFCIDYTIWPGWNHRGVFFLSRHKQLRTRIRRKLSLAAHRRMRIQYHREVNTTVCNPDDFTPMAVERWHPHKRMMKDKVRAPISPVVSRSHRRNLRILD